MAERAQVTSTEALEQFRNQLILYISKARPALEEVTADVLRVRSWMDNDQRLLWENQMRRRGKELEMAQAALFSAKLGNLREESAAEVLMVHRAKRSVEEAETKLRTLKRWNREFDGRVQPLVKQMEKLHSVLSNDLVKAVASLNMTIDKLAAYTQSTPPISVDVPQAPPANPDKPANTSEGGASK